MKELNYIFINRDEMTILDDISEDELLERLKGKAISSNGLELGTIMSAEFKDNWAVVKLGVLPN